MPLSNSFIEQFTRGKINSIEAFYAATELTLTTNRLRLLIEGNLSRDLLTTLNGCVNLNALMINIDLTSNNADNLECLSKIFHKIAPRLKKLVFLISEISEDEEEEEEDNLESEIIQVMNTIAETLPECKLLSEFQLVLINPEIQIDDLKADIDRALTSLINAIPTQNLNALKICLPRLDVLSLEDASRFLIEDAVEKTFQCELIDFIKRCDKLSLLDIEGCFFTSVFSQIPDYLANRHLSLLKLTGQFKPSLVTELVKKPSIARRIFITNQANSLLERVSHYIKNPAEREAGETYYQSTNEFLTDLTKAIYRNIGIQELIIAEDGDAGHNKDFNDKLNRYITPILKRNQYFRNHFNLLEALRGLEKCRTIPRVYLTQLTNYDAPFTHYIVNEMQRLKIELSPYLSDLVSGIFPKIDDAQSAQIASYLTASELTRLSHAKYGGLFSRSLKQLEPTEAASAEEVHSSKKRCIRTEH